MTFAPGSTIPSSTVPGAGGGRPAGPRNRFPGDILLRWNLNRLQYFEQMHRQYGDCVYFRAAKTDFFLFYHPDAVRDVLVAQDECFMKGPSLRRARSTLGDGLLTSEGDFHRRQRRLAQPAFHPTRVCTYGQAMADIAEAASRQWRDGQEIDLHQEMMRITLRIVAKTLFGAEVEADIEQIGRAMDITVSSFTRTMLPWGPLLNRLPLPSTLRFHRARRRLFQTIDRFIANHRQSGDQGDLLSVLIRGRDTEGDQGAMSQQLLRDESYTIFTAGHETTANALTFAIDLLSRHPDHQRRIGEEVAVVLNGRTPTVEDVERLPFTRMVLCEAMRLYPPAWALGRQALCDATIAGQFVPKDAVVLLMQWVTHRDERWYPDALRFDPARWTDDERNKRPRWSYFPFGGGSRQCIGESFAWMEATLVLAALAKGWRFESLSQTPTRVFPTITLRPSGAVPVRLIKR